MTQRSLKHSTTGRARKVGRLKRAKRTRLAIRESNSLRLTVHRTPRHMYAQVIDAEAGGDRVLVQASTLDKTLKNGNGGNVEAASAVGTLVAERAVAAGVRKVAFDRSGYRYHGRVKALAEAARAGGLEF
ncbi:MAG: 50S ribosomal protein L18 [Gammaproteobacteria bacterium]|nr:50S ribosomal protein L18 [Gammaproteobacteria bacterium]MYF31016.1 50S ribosomal protein L18 [Gammaproteobacteria bacterium]MYK44973.1 50S ribosomal protein L18 [Gammaproteobacteria bacterium]